MSLSKYMSTRETTNLARVARLILGPCTDVLRDILRKEVPPSTLSRTVRTFIDHLKNQNAKNPLSTLSRQQADLIFPPPSKQYGGNYSDFDVTILYLLLRNVSNITEHAAGWGNQPNPGDRSVSANIERIRLIRNKYYGHTSDFSLAESDFRQEWRNIHDIIVELESSLGTTTALQDSVNEIKTCSMDPDLEKKYIDDHCVIPKHVKAQHETEYIRKWKEEDSVFVETHGFPEMLQKVREQRYVTFVGVPGSGKSSTAQHIALILQREGYEIVPVLDFRDLIQYCDPQNPQVFIINDVVGVLGVNKAKLESFVEYERKMTKPSSEKTKVLLTCRETLFNQCYKSFFTNEQNVIKLHSSENELSEDDQRNILEKHGLDRHLLSPALLTESSRMFPLLCKLYSKEEKFRINGERFFISPIQCIVQEFDKMQQRNSLFYATLVLCTLNNNILSEDILKDDKNKCFGEMKRKVLERCEVESNTDTFKFVKALSAMEGTYTKRRGRIFTFIHDSIFEITAYHFGTQFPELILEYMRSSYIANCVKLQICETENERNIETNDKCTSLESTAASSDEKPESKECIDLCIRVPKNQYPMLAERLYRDIENMELYDVFMNNALKDNQLSKAFLDVLKIKTYTELMSLFLYNQQNVSKILKRQHSWNDKENSRIERSIEELLLDKKRIFREPETYNVRVISWVIYYGHHKILKYIIDQTELHKETTAALSGDYFANFGGLCNKRWREALSGDFMPLGQRFTIRNRNAIIEQTRLLVLSCFGGDDETVRILLNHVKLDDCINRAQEQDRFSGNYRRHTPLIAACKCGHLNIVKELLKSRVNVNQKSKFISRMITSYCDNSSESKSFCDTDCTPLTIACEGGYLFVVKELLKAGANVNPKGLHDSPLNAACRGGHFSVVVTLLKAGADVSPEGVDNSPLINACLVGRGHGTVIKKLLTSKANVNYQNDEGSTALLLSIIQRRDKGIIKNLIEAGADVNIHNKDLYTPLAAACGTGDLNLVKELLEMGAFINPQDLWYGYEHRVQMLTITASRYNVPMEYFSEFFKDGRIAGHITPLTSACHNGNLCIVKMLLEKGANVNPKYVFKTPLTVACAYGLIDVLKMILEFGAKVNYNPWETCVWTPNVYKSPLTVACETGNLELIRELLKTNVNPLDYRMPLLAACEEGYISVVRELIKKGPGVNLPTKNTTPLIAACKVGHDNVVRELLSNGAIVNLQGQYATPLIAACESGHCILVKKLLNAGAEINRQIAGSTPLSTACRKGHEDIVIQLLKGGANVNLQNQEGETSLYVAVENENTPLSLLKILIESGADCTVCKNSGLSPLFIALIKNKVQIILKLLQQTNNKQMLKMVNLHLFNILVDIRHADVTTDSKDDVVLSKKRVWNVEKDWFIQLFRPKCNVLRHLLCIGLDSNQRIRICNGHNEVNVKPLLF